MNGEDPKILPFSENPCPPGRFAADPAWDGERMHSTIFRNFAITAAMVIVSFMMIGLAFAVVSRNVFVTETRDSVMNSSQEVSRMASAYAQAGILDSREAP